MTIKTELDLDYTNLEAQACETARKILNERENPEDFILGLPDSLEADRDNVIANEWIKCQHHVLLENFRDIVNRRKHGKYRNGDLWLLADALEVEDKIQQTIYEEFERLKE